MTRFRLGVTVLTWAIFAGALVGSDSQPQVVVLGGIVCVIAAAGFIASDLVGAASPLEWARAPQPLLTRVDDDAVMAITSQIRGARRSSAELRDTLVSLADERLLDRHGIDRAGQPAAALALLGPGLLALVDQHRIRISGLTDLHRLLDEIESI